MLARLGFSFFGASVVITLATGGVAQHLGAHPGWAITVALIGAPLGALAAMFLPARIWLAAGAALTSTAAFIAADWGKMRFIASVAEDALAGQVWFIGWIATAALAAMTLGLSFRTLKSPAQR